MVLKTIPQFCFQIFSGKFLFLFSSRERFLDTMFQNWNPLRKSIRNPFWWWMGWVLLIIYFLPNIACYKCILLQYGFLHLIICNPKRCPKNDNGVCLTRLITILSPHGVTTCWPLFKRQGQPTNLSFVCVCNCCYCILFR